MIRQLSEETIKKIAAGEVIEGPFSVVKELVENSIDSAADQIRVSIKKGGKESIIVSDNGSGIEASDFDKAFLPHATSKINDFDDLYKIFSLGFRGEALASIVSVAEIKARSRSANASLGLEYHFKSGKLSNKGEIAMNKGTVMEVYKLFSEIPVRKKFMKSDLAESNKISRLMYSLAIGHPAISFSFDKDNKRIFTTPGAGALADSLLLLYGRQYYESLVEIKGENNLYKIKGYISNNSFYRSNRQMQFLYVNGRYIEEDQVREAIEAVYKSVIPNGRFPAFQLFIESDAKNLDINIHPNKKKIHFNEIELLIDLIEKSVRNALFNKLSLPNFTDNSGDRIFRDLSGPESYKKILETYAWTNKNTKSTDLLIESDLEGIDNITEEDDKLSDSDIGFADFSDTFDNDVSTENINFADLIEINDESHDYTNPSEDRGKIRVFFDNKESGLLADIDALNYLGSVFNVYCLFEDPKNQLLYFMDQHAAHERINYEKFKKQFLKGQVVSQPFIRAITLALTPEEKGKYLEKEKFLKNMGFDLEIFSDGEILVRACPIIFADAKIEDILYDLINMDIKGLEDYDHIIDSLAMKACKASVKQGDKLKDAEAINLYKDLLKCDYPLTCPHGRPTIIKKSKYDLEKAFLRIK